jgi:hypothetical protein
MSEKQKRRPGGVRKGAGRPPSYWRGTIGREAKVALQIMALQDLVDEGDLLARLILAERARRLTQTAS